MTERNGFFKAEVGPQLEDPRIVQAVELFEKRSALVDAVVRANDAIDHVIQRKRIDPQITAFLVQQFVAVAAEIEEKVLSITVAGEKTVRELAAAHQVLSPKERAGAHFLSKDARNELGIEREILGNIVDEQNQKPFWKRDLWQPVFLRVRAKRMNNAAGRHEDAAAADVISFLTAAQAHRGEQVVASYHSKIREIEELTEMAERISMYKNGDARAPAVALEAGQCEVLFTDYIRHPSIELRQKLVRAVDTLHTRANFNSEDITARVEEWKLRIGQDLAAALGMITAREAIAQGSTPKAVVAAAEKVRSAAAEALEWLGGITQKMQSGEIKSEMNVHILSLLQNRDALLVEPKLAAFYDAIHALEHAGKPKEPKRLVQPEARRAIYVPPPEYISEKNFEAWLSQELPVQFYREITMLQLARLIENNGIKGIDGKFYPVPTLEVVREHAYAKREILQEKFAQGFTRLQIIPFALPLSKFHTAAERAILDHHERKKLFAPKKSPTDPDDLLALDTKEPVWRWNDLKGADENGKLKYYPDKFDPEHHGGRTKQETITLGVHGVTDGFQFQLVEDDVNIPRAGANITVGGRQRIEAGKTGSEYFYMLGRGQYTHEFGRTYEAWYTRLLSQLNEKNEVTDDWQGKGSTSWLTENYMPASDHVGLAAWYRDNRRAEVGGSYPRHLNGECGLSSAVEF